MSSIHIWGLRGENIPEFGWINWDDINIEKCNREKIQLPDPIIYVVHDCGGFSIKTKVDFEGTITELVFFVVEYNRQTVEEPGYKSLHEGIVTFYPIERVPHYPNAWHIED